MVELLNPGSSYSIMVNRMDGSFIYYFLALRACIWGNAHMRKVIAVDGTHLYGKKFGEKFRERHAFVDGKENIFVPYVKRILRDNKSASYSLYVSNLNGVLDQYTMFGNDVTSKVKLLERICSCRKFDLVKMPCEHMMAALQEKYDDGEGYDNSIYDYSSPIYKAESYLLTYSKAINVVPPDAE
ncbi:hypothetical protein BC332_25296 [Capsicum chinense]|nr:hypothetical protein BC332_25296 [Capsicum chinense]